LSILFARGECHATVHRWDGPRARSVPVDAALSRPPPPRLRGATPATCRARSHPGGGESLR